MSETPPSPSESGYRAGRYVSQATGYRAFSPEPLPPNPLIRMEGNLQSLLSLADRELGRLDGSLGSLENFLHSGSDLPQLVQIGLAHVQFETIHPFLDGKGRIGRLLITFLLCQREIFLKPVLYLSHFFKRNRALRYQPYIDLFGENPSEESQPGA